MKHLTQRRHFHTGVTPPGSLLQMWDSSLIAVSRGHAGDLPTFGSKRLAEGNMLLYLGGDRFEPEGRTYIRCMSAFGICWVFPNVVRVVWIPGEE